MPALTNETIPYAALVSASPKTATLTLEQPLSAVALNALMLSVTEKYVSAEAGGLACALVSSTLDVTGDISALTTDVIIEADIARKTRTMAFAGAIATSAGQTILTVTAVYKFTNAG